MCPSGLPIRTSHAAQVLQPQIIGGETLIWSGRPDRKAFASSNPLRSIIGRVIFIFGVIMIYLALENLASNPRSPAGFILMFGIIFVIFGGNLAVKTFINWWGAPHTFYGVTNKRAIILRTRPWLKIDSFESRQIAFVLSEPSEKNDLGNVIFTDEPFGRVRGLRAAVGFWGVEHAGEAETALKRLKNRIAEPS